MNKINISLPSPVEQCYCRKCALSILKEWKGWPHIDQIPILPLVKDGLCENCGSVSEEPLCNHSLTWMAVSSSHCTGLPDYWQIDIGSASQGYPYYSIGTCPVCRDSTIISEVNYPNGTTEYKYNCDSCGIQSIDK